MSSRSLLYRGIGKGDVVCCAQLDAWTEQYEAEEARRSQEAAAKLADEGWTVVKRKRVCIFIMSLFCSTQFADGSMSRCRWKRSHFTEVYGCPSLERYDVRSTMDTQSCTRLTGAKSSYWQSNPMKV